MRKSCNVLFLTTATALWGLSIVSQALGNAYMGPFTFNVARFVVGAVALSPCLIFIARREKTNGRPSPLAGRRTLFGGGVLTGVVFFWSISLQQIGLLSVPAGKALFINSLYMVFVPVVNFFRGRRSGGWVWLGVILAAAGMYLLCVKDSFHLTRGELICLGSACGYTFHILCIDRYSPRVDCFYYTAVQFAVVALISSAMMLKFETPDLNDILLGWKPVCFSGIIAGCVAYTLQALGQRNFDPAIASLLLSMETVYGLIGSWIILGQILTPREISGCVLMFCAVILAQMPFKKTQTA